MGGILSSTGCSATMSAKIISLLSQTSLFGGLEADDLTTCALAFKERRFAKGQMLFLRGDPGTHLYLVETGLVRLAISNAGGRRLSFQIAMEGDLFGEIAVLDHKPRTADATALTEVTVHCLEHHLFCEIWSTRPALSKRVVLFLCRRLRQMTHQIESVALQPVDVRVARFILSSLGSHRAPPGKRIPIELGFSQGELSQLIGATRPKVNAAIASLEKAGAVRRTLDRLFCDPEALARIARHSEDD
jgi:CRP/FNR family transcriptional regulator, cyclic AMP receptor protein